jgi:hypothetical protein
VTRRWIQVEVEEEEEMWRIQVYYEVVLVVEVASVM